MCRFFNKGMTVEVLTKRDLIKAIKKEAKGRIPPEDIENMADEAVKNLDWDDTYQMQISNERLATNMVENHFSNKGK